LLNKGNRSAFEEIYLRYDSLLYIYAYRKLRDKAEAQDVVQEIFINLWANRLDFKLNTSLSSYLYKSVLNKILNLFKHKQIIQKYIDAGDHYIDAFSEGTDYLIREKEINALIEKEIAAMPPRMREIYLLKRRDFLSTKEIADQLQLSEFTVSTQIKRALKLLRLKLGLIVFLLYIINQ